MSFSPPRWSRERNAEPLSWQIQHYLITNLCRLGVVGKALSSIISCDNPCCHQGWLQDILRCTALLVLYKMAPGYCAFRVCGPSYTFFSVFSILPILCLQGAAILLSSLRLPCTSTICVRRALGRILKNLVRAFVCFSRAKCVHLGVCIFTS